MGMQGVELVELDLHHHGPAERQIYSDPSLLNRMLVASQYCCYFDTILDTVRRILRLLLLLWQLLQLKTVSRPGSRPCFQLLN